MLFIVLQYLHVFCAHECLPLPLLPSVIDTLDGLKKGRENYAAREAIKFLEKALQGGGRWVRVQRDDETMQPGRRKPLNQDIETWYILF